jgi:hypothetical protein
METDLLTSAHFDFTWVYLPIQHSFFSFHALMLPWKCCKQSPIHESLAKSGVNPTTKLTQNHEILEPVDDLSCLQILKLSP